MDYVATARRTTSQIKRNGMTFPLVRGGGVVINSEGVEIDEPEENLSIIGIVVEYKTGEIDGKLILAGDTRLVTTNEQEIRAGDRIDVYGTLYRVIKPNPVKPAGVLICYRLQLRA